MPERFEYILDIYVSFLWFLLLQIYTMFSLYYRGL